jgi:hypothetical protein
MAQSTGVSKLRRVYDFVSIGRQGTGTAETVRHGLGVVPSSVEIIPYASTVAWSVDRSALAAQTLAVTVDSSAYYDLLVSVDG